MMTFPDPTLLAIPFFVLTVALEWWAVRTRRARGAYDTKDALSSLAMGLGSVVSGVLFGFVAAAGSLFIWRYRLAEIPFSIWSLALAFVLYDLVYYWKHRFMHRMRWFWASHVVHHSSEHYNLTTALRQPWTGPISGLFIVGVPMLLMGFHPGLIAFVGGSNLVYQYWIHTEAIDKCPAWFEAIFNTPSHHRVHHGRNPRYLDANYAGVLIIWDRMFGTFVPELESDKPDYGLTTPLKNYNPFWVAIHEYWALLRDCARDGWRVWRWPMRLVAPPGWSPTGDHQTSVTMKRAYLQAHPEHAGTPGFQTVLATPETRGKHHENRNKL